MNEWTRVICPKCNGERVHPEEHWYRHPTAFVNVPCQTCLGVGILLARPVELKQLDRDREAKA